MRHSLIHSVAVLLLAVATAVAGDKVPLKTSWPDAYPEGTPREIKIPVYDARPNKPPTFLVPDGSVNLARDKKVTSSNEPVYEELTLITDGDKAADAKVDLKAGKQWVQLDLEKTNVLHAVIVWHCHMDKRVYRDVMVQVSDDPKFEKGVTTLFDNSSAGKDRPYVESRYGRIMDAKGVNARYVRLYSSGNTTDTYNHYNEVEVFGKPAA